MGLIILLFVLSTLIPPQEYKEVLQVIFIVPSGEQLTDSEQEYTLQSIRNGYTFWNKDIPEVQSSITAIDTDPYGGVITEWCICVLSATDSTTIYVIDNSSGKQLLFNSQGGYAQEYYKFIVLVYDASPVELSARVAHELGHILYSLPDFYTEPLQCQQIDIMCYPQIAYEKRFIGCLSLAYIGAPCIRTTLPLIIKG